MTFVITSPCIDTLDQACVEVCPVDCIHYDEGTDRMDFIDPVECIDCGACIPACPVDAIFVDDEVPADQQQFVEINALWFKDKDAARALVEGGAPPAVEREPAAERAADEPAEAAASADEAPPAEAAAASTEEAVAVPAAVAQVEALDETPRQGVIVPSYRQSSPLGLIALVGLVVSLFIMWVFPGARWSLPDTVLVGNLEGPTKAGVFLGIVPALFFLMLFIRSQAKDMASFAASHSRQTSVWRDVHSTWRRSEESRRYELTKAVQLIAGARYHFPSDERPGYRTHVNVPEPTLALEFGGGGGEKAFPDIIVVEYPGNYPVMVAQVETPETLTREQAQRVWAKLETTEAALDIYIPAGLAALAKDYARAAGIKHVRFRTWRRTPTGVTVREV